MHKKKPKYDIITVLGPTATGKTAFAAQLAEVLDGEIISADSRQVYQKMDLGTGKDIADYQVGDKSIPYHLINIKVPGYQYNVYEYQSDFLRVFTAIQERNKQAILCGGTGMYIEAVLKGYKLINVPVNEVLRNELQQKSLDELIAILSTYKTIHNNSDIENKKRATRAIEIEVYYKNHPEIDFSFPVFNYFILGIKFDRNRIRKRITERLRQRLEEGMVDEVKELLNSGLKPEDLIYYGLEYKYLTQFVLGEISYDEMFKKLNTAIHQFSKRQMTWFRRMERNGMKIHWLDGYMPMEEKIERALKLLEK